MALYFLVVRFPSASSNDPESKGHGAREYPFYQTESEDAAHVFLELFKASADPVSIWDEDTDPVTPVYDLCYGEGLSAAERVRYRSTITGLKDRRDSFADSMLPAIRLFDFLKAHHDRAIEWEPTVMEEVFNDLSKRTVTRPPNIGPHFLTARFPVAILQRKGQKIPKEEADLIYEKEDHVFYETGSRVVAEHVVKMLRHGKPEPDDEDFFSTEPIFRLRPGWPLEVPQRISYRQALEQLAAINEAPDDLDSLRVMGLPTDPRSLWLWSLYKEAKQLERLVLDELGELADDNCSPKPAAPLASSNPKHTGRPYFLLTSPVRYYSGPFPEEGQDRAEARSVVTGCVFYETDLEVVATELVRLFETTGSAPVVTSRGISPPPSYEVCDGAGLRVSQRVLYRDALQKLKNEISSGQWTPQEGIPEGLEEIRIFLMRCHERALQWEPLVRNELDAARGKQKGFYVWGTWGSIYPQDPTVDLNERFYFYQAAAEETAARICRVFGRNHGDELQFGYTASEALDIGEVARANDSIAKYRKGEVVGDDAAFFSDARQCEIHGGDVPDWTGQAKDSASASCPENGGERPKAILALLNPLVRIDTGLRNLSVSMARLRKENPYGMFSDPPATEMTFDQEVTLQDRISRWTAPIKADIKEAEDKCVGIARHVTGVISDPALWETNLRTNLRLLADEVSGFYTCGDAATFKSEEEWINGHAAALYMEGTRLQDAYATVAATKAASLPAAPEPESKSTKHESTGGHLTKGDHETQPSVEGASADIAHLLAEHASTTLRVHGWLCGAFRQLMEYQMKGQQADKNKLDEVFGQRAREHAVAGIARLDQLLGEKGTLIPDMPAFLVVFEVAKAYVSVSDGVFTLNGLSFTSAHEAAWQTAFDLFSTCKEVWNKEGEQYNFTSKFFEHVVTKFTISAEDNSRIHAALAFEEHRAVERGLTVIGNPTTRKVEWSFGATAIQRQTATAPNPPPAPEKQCNHSVDFTSVIWFGTRYQFTKTQATCVGLLWAEWEKGDFTLSEKTIGEKIISANDNYRLRHTFRVVATAKKGRGKVTMHPAWGTMIVAGGKGLFRLASVPNPKKKKPQ